MGLNYYQSFYNKQGDDYKVNNFHVDKVLKNRWDRTKKLPTNTQMQYHKDLIDFLASKGVEVRSFLKPRNSKICSSRINAMWTIIKKNGWEAEFQEKRFGSD